MRSRRLAGEIVQAVTSAVDDGRLDAELVRRFVVSPAPAFDVLRLHASPDGDGANPTDPGPVFAEIPLSDFLDEIDALETPADGTLPREIARRVAALRDEACAALEHAATGSLASLPRNPGFFLAWPGRPAEAVVTRPAAAVAAREKDLRVEPWSVATPKPLEPDLDAALAASVESYAPTGAIALAGEPLAVLGAFVVTTEGAGTIDGETVALAATAACLSGERLAVATRDGTLRLLDRGLRDVRPPVPLGAASALAAGEGWIAAVVSGDLVFLDAEGARRAAVHLDPGAPRAIAGHRGRLYAATAEGLLVFDAPAARLAGRLPFACDSLEITGGRALAGGRLLDLGDPARPQVTHVLPASTRRLLASAPDRVVLADASVAWTLALPRGGTPRVVSAFSIPPGPAQLAGDRLVVGTSLFARRAVEPPRILAPEERVEAWLVAELERIVREEPAFSLGAIRLDRTGPRFRALFDGPRSLVGLEHDAVYPAAREAELDLKALDAFETGEARRDAAVRRAWRAVLERVLRRAPSTGAFRRLAAGRVWLAIREGGVLAWVHAAVDPAREWRPHRRAIPRSAPKASLEARLSAAGGARHVDEAAARARSDWTVRAELLDIASRGYEFALRAAALVADVDEEGVTRAFLAAVSDARPQDDPTELAWRLDFLEKRRERPGVAEALARFRRGPV